MVGDGPVRAEGERGARVPQVAQAPGVGGPGGAESAGPLVSAVGAGVGGVRGLHRRGHPDLREPGQQLVGSHLDVLDPVPAPAVRPEGGQGVQDVAHGRVSDGVRGGPYDGR
ncbi:hypothetical protein GCM10010251_28700 [Streptomyces aurantiogriseus]|uniref:Uncharacterized protein n=1 Tax=Streptomyces aurantiogriseus TaxID=66870 RepID=A0A918C8U7_9ACTN|nr:hypothetical protein GCM10010251_28700 [Streptomyces aurantiogriseus]